MMNDDAPEGTLPRRMSNKKILTELPDPPCPERALRRVIIINVNDCNGKALSR